MEQTAQGGAPGQISHVPQILGHKVELLPLADRARIEQVVKPKFGNEKGGALGERLTAPAEAGRARGVWRLCNRRGGHCRQEDNADQHIEKSAEYAIPLFSASCGVASHYHLTAQKNRDRISSAIGEYFYELTPKSSVESKITVQAPARRCIVGRLGKYGAHNHTQRGTPRTDCPIIPRQSMFSNPPWGRSTR